MSVIYQPIAQNAISAGRPPKLLEQVSQRLRARHYALRTEEAYIHWIRRFILFHNKRHPAEMGGSEIEAFLTDLAVRGRVAAATQTQAWLNGARDSGFGVWGYLRIALRIVERFGEPSQHSAHVLSQRPCGV